MEVFDDQKLLADYHRLPPQGQQELLETLAHLLIKYHAGPSAATLSENQCILEKPKESRPETSREPFFTE